MSIKRKLGIAGLAILVSFVLLVIVAGIVGSQREEEEQPTTDISLDEAKANALYDLEYDTLLRSNEEYVNSIVYYKGEVVDVVHRWDDTYQLFITLDTDELFSSDWLAVHYTGPRILEDDLVEVYGVVNGLYKYKTVRGDQNIVPEIDALYLERIMP